jgi:hypothetical protein
VSEYRRIPAKKSDSRSLAAAPDYDWLGPDGGTAWGHRSGNLMNKRTITAFAAAALMLGLTAGVANAAITYDPATDTGFVGKGDVQYTYGWNNRALNDNAGSLKFARQDKLVEEWSWECRTVTNNGSIKEQEKKTKEISFTRTIVSKVVRDNKKQVTGFGLDGLAGAAIKTIESPAEDDAGYCKPGSTLVAPNPDFPEGPQREAGILHSSSTQFQGLRVTLNDGITYTDLLEQPTL